MVRRNVFFVDPNQFIFFCILAAELQRKHTHTDFSTALVMLSYNFLKHPKTGI